MSVDSKSVRGRRQLSYASFDELLADADRLNAQRHANLGQLAAELLGHLAATINASMDGITGVKVKPPLMMRLLGPLLKGRVLRKGLSPGIRLSKSVEKAPIPRAARHARRWKRCARPSSARVARR